MRVAVVLTARPSYSKLKPVLSALVARGVDVQLIACASALLERYGNVSAVARKDFPDVDITECYSTYEGANLITSAKETGALLTELSGVLQRLRPDMGIVCADRHEVLAAAAALRLLEIPLLHLQGGESSGSVDNSIRDMVTCGADYHCVCTEQARHRVYGLTGAWERIWNTGCPSIDLARQALTEPPVTVSELGGSGAAIDLDPTRFMPLPLVVWLQHPVTSEVAEAEPQMIATATALHRGCYDVIALWPGEDAGADAGSKVIRRNQDVWHTVRSLPPARFLKLLTQASVIVGNSSAGIRESAFLGTPVVNVGSRQFGRERAANVVDVPHDSEAIHGAIQRQIKHGPYPSSALYGAGNAGEQIAEVICERVGVDSRACGV